MRPAIIALAIVLAACSTPEPESRQRAEPQPALQPERIDVGGTPPPTKRPQTQSIGKTEAEAAADVAQAMRTRQVVSIADIGQPRGRESYREWPDNPVRAVADEPLSTFSIDVDGASFSVVRSYLQQGRLPPADAVRSEEIINALAVDYGGYPTAREPVAVHTRLMATPWNGGTRLLQVGLQAWQPAHAELPPSNYVFLIDVSGSMQGDDRLGLIKRAFAVMLDRLRAEDTVALVTYAAGSRTVLEPTPISERSRIVDALASLDAGGSTHASDGIQRAYRLARQGFIDGGNNRVILATDGDVNVGLRGQALVDMIERERDGGIFLTVLGVGQGNYMDAQLEPLADHGDGNYYYLDSFREAQRVLVTGLSGTAYTVARDVKIQVEFNPAVVAEYRLIGYNNRQLAREDFNNDARDAGDMGAGHTVTALYEITLRDGAYRFVDERRYAQEGPAGAHRDELALVKLRYKRSSGGASRLVQQAVQSRDLDQLQAPSAAVVAAAFAEKLRRSPWLQEFGWDALKRFDTALGQGENARELAAMIETAALLDR